MKLGSNMAGRTGIWMSVICLLSVVLVAVSVYSMYGIKERTTIIYKHSYVVSSTAKDMLSRLSGVQNYSKKLLTDKFKSRDDAERYMLSNTEASRRQAGLIAERYLGPEADTKKLVSDYERLVAARMKAVAFALEHNDGETVRYLEENIDSLYDEVFKDLDTIMTFADNNVRRLEHESTFTFNAATLMLAMLILALVCFSFFSYRLQRKRGLEVAYRQRLFDLISLSVDDVFLICVGHKMEYISENCERVLGFSPEALAIDGGRFYSLLGADDETKDGELGRLIRGISESSLTETAEYNFLLGGLNTMQKRYINMKVLPTVGNDGIARYVIVISDETKERESQQTLKDALVGAQRANSAKRDFLSRMSHEIRTPMNAIIGMVTIAAAHIKERDRVEDCLRKIGFSSKHLLSLINDVLDISKIEDGKLTITKEPFELRQLTDSVSSIIYQQARDKGIGFEVRLNGVDEEMVVGDCMRLNQILLNLLSNAVKFTPSGGRISLDIKQIPQKNGGVRMDFTVSDTGIGMSEEFLKRLYLPFEQADGTISQKYGGTGLGMSITKNLVSLMDGTIQVKSEIGKGTSFTVELPLALPGGGLSLLRPPSSVESLSVLIVDDDLGTCEHAKILLERMKIAAQWVQSGEEAVRKVRSAHETGEDFDVCFIDWQMPEMDGIETTRNIRRIVGPDTLIIIITAYDWSCIEQEAREAGADAFLAKPFFQSSMYNTLMAVRGHRHGKIDESAAAGRQKFDGVHILLAEDNELNCEIAVEMFKLIGVTVDCAGDGQRCVESFMAEKSGTYDAIFMDIQMPVMDGYSAAKTIRGSIHPEAKTMPIIAMTANAFSEDVSAALAAGMNGHIAKPIDLDILVRMLNKYVKKMDDDRPDKNEA
ncbi:response regulator [Cloacibacillus porcorum]|uniref:hybrid sensor histidine kinase/response regulator n=2 Tax=Cloacibacillus porcorum TaxID=1197717 RepID=UPI0023F15B20|nr:response regulator [Cloacibacillus porcorum]MDD7649870.1 response regulator [Cloacibacillus porcorum]MDY4093215.1 response regulator [Cloacibacillus porcorum]